MAQSMARAEEQESVAPERLPEDHDFASMTPISLVDAAIADILPLGVFLEQTRRMGWERVTKLVISQTEHELARKRRSHREF